MKARSAIACLRSSGQALLVRGIVASGFPAAHNRAKGLSTMKRALMCLLAVAVICGVVMADSGLPFRAKRQQPTKIDQAQQRKPAEKKQIPVDPSDPNGWKMLSLWTAAGHQKPGEYYRMRKDLEAKDKKYGDMSQRVIVRDGKTYVESHEFFMPPADGVSRQPDDEPASTSPAKYWHSGR